MDILTDTQIEDYLATLDLDNNPDIKTVLMSLTPLSTDTFRQVMSGLAGTVVTLQDISQLPTVNDFTVDKLLGQKFASNDSYVLRNKYKVEILPSLANFYPTKIAAIGDITTYIKKTLHQFTYLISPKFNFIVSEENGFFNFEDALSFYNSAAASAEVATEITNFIAFFDANKATYPNILAATSTSCDICTLISDTATKPLFLEIQNGPYTNTQTPTMQWLLNDIYPNVIPENFESIMNDNYELMAANNAADVSTYGETGRIILDVQTDVWTDIQTVKTKLTVDKARINLYYLPVIYDETAMITQGATEIAFLITFLTEAKDTLWRIRNIINTKFDDYYAAN